MGLTKDVYTVEVAGSRVTVTGTTGFVHATWTLLVDDSEVDTAAAAGDFRLRGELPDGTRVEAAVHQSLLGPTRVVITHDGTEVLAADGYVA